MLLVQPNKRVTNVEDAANLPITLIKAFKLSMHIDMTLYAITNTNTSNPAGLKMARGAAENIKALPI